MCFSVSLLLDDNETIIGLDFYMDSIQQYIEEMNEQIDGISMIVNEGGMIVGHNDASLVGKDYTVLKDYTELINKVFNLYGDYFEYTVTAENKEKYTVFSDKTTYGWYLIVCLPSSAISMDMDGHTLIVNIILGLIWLVCILFFSVKYSQYVSVNRELATQENFIKNVSEGLRAPVVELSQQIEFSNEKGSELYSSIKPSVDELKQNLEDIISFRKIIGNKADETEIDKKYVKKDAKYKRYSVAIVGILLIASIVAVVVNTYTQLNFINAHMENEEDVYYSQMRSWIENNITLTNDLALHLGAQPKLYEDYDKAVKYIDDVVKDNDDISVAYIVNPAWEHAVIMNNGWESDDPNWHVEERDWYVDTILSDKGFNISTPYQDEQTGIYCVTFSQIVYDENGNIVGLIGIDFYMDKLINILGESYTDEGYAFLTDPSYTILNHPHENYQMSLDKSTNGAETEYREALVSEKLTLEKDYDGKYKVVLAKREPSSGFTVVTIRDAWLIYGTLIVTDITLVVVFFISIVFVLIITRYMSRQQEKLFAELKEAAENAIEAGNAKSVFLAQMSHEIRTPINAVLGMNEMILREAKEENIVSYASNAYSAGNALLAIINDILDISKIEAGKLEISDDEYELYELISDCYSMTADRALKKNLKFSVLADESLPKKLRGDMIHVRQIAINFITNAIKYTDEDFVEISFGGKRKEDGFILQIDVKDSGIGISEEDIEQLFTSFKRFDIKRNQSVEGTGLGLTICKQLAELMNGTVEVKSNKGEGSTFSCFIPQVIVDEAPIGKITLNEKLMHKNVEGEKKFVAPDTRILVVDDVEMNLLVFKSMLKEHKIEIDEALSGSECLELIKDRKYDIIFMDHMMPQMDGMETFEEMQKMEHANKETPVVMLTANAISGEKEKYLSAGFSYYLTKPIRREKLEKAVLMFLPKEKIHMESVETDNAADNDVRSVIKDTDGKNAGTELVDINAGLPYVGDSLETYYEVLESYVEEGVKKFDSINNYFASEKWNDYVIEVHALKSTSLTIGSKQLSELAKELELAGKAGNHDLIRKKHGELMALYERVLSIGKDMLSENTSSVVEEENEIKGSIGQEQLKERIERIKVLLDSFDIDEILSVCNELSAYTYNGEPLSDVFKKVVDAADDFEFDEVAAELDSVVEKLNLR